MRASQLLGSIAYAPDGTKLGHVLDIETKRDGPKVSDAWGPALRLSGLLIGPAAEFARLGYLRRQMNGPLGVRFIGRRLSGYIVRWDQIARISPGRIELRCAADELEPLRPPQG
jgi:hypothetical protein